MIRPLVSIVCTVYNKEPWLKQTIDSFLQQETDFPFDIILIDDASSDGSKEILASYAQRYPDKIRVYYNEKNIGIARTWLKVCDLVEAPYIARCDGDDYWICTDKLQIQMQSLQENPESKWSSTDINFVNEEGQILGQSIFESGQMPYVHDFETMLATRGFLAPSTWLVETKLIQEINHQIHLDTADDTFDIQLDLFQKTRLTYLPQATVAYRINQGSDSRPKDFAKIEHRFNRLLETQNNYLDKYPMSDYREMLRILLDRNNRYELELTKKEAGLSQSGIEKVIIDFDRSGKDFNQEDTVEYSIGKSDSIVFSLPSDCSRIRVDLSEIPSFFQRVSLVSMRSGTEILPCFTNAIILGSAYIFPNSDPQITYNIPVELFGREFQLNYAVFELDDIHSNDYIGKILAQDLLDAKAKIRELQRDKGLYQEALRVIEEQKKDLLEVTRLYNAVTHSRRWTIPTKIINFLRRRK